MCQSLYIIIILLLRSSLCVGNCKSLLSESCYLKVKHYALVKVMPHLPDGISWGLDLNLGGWTRSITCTTFFAELAQKLTMSSMYTSSWCCTVIRDWRQTLCASLASFDIKLSLTNPIPSILASYQCIQCLLDSCQPVQCKLHTAPLNYTLPYSLANLGPARQQTQLVWCYKSAKQEYP